MHDFSVRRRASSLVVLTAAVSLAACEDARIKELNTGITKDSAITVMAQEVKGGGHDSLPNVYLREPYLIGGKNIEVLYFSPDNQKAVKDTVFTKVTPVVFVNFKLAGRGWAFWDSVSKAHGIPLKKR
jgi:hypothetical protein